MLISNTDFFQERLQFLMISENRGGKTFTSLLRLLVQREAGAGGKLDGHLDVIKLTGIQVIVCYSL